MVLGKLENHVGKKKKKKKDIGPLFYITHSHTHKLKEAFASTEGSSSSTAALVSQPSDHPQTPPLVQTQQAAGSRCTVGSLQEQQAEEGVWMGKQDGMRVEEGRG